MNYTNEHFKENNHYGTPKHVWQSIRHLIPTGITLFDPFFFDGQSGKDMKEVFPKNKIIHEEGIDFFDHSVAYDMILTNPPFSKARCILKRLKQVGKPFMILLPTPRINTQYFIELFRDDDNLQLVIPSKRIHFVSNELKKKSNANFDCVWIAYKCHLPKDILFL